MAGTDEVSGGRGGACENSSGAGTLGGIDTGRYPGCRVDGDGVAGSQRVLVGGPHEGQTELVSVLVGHGCAQVPGSVADHPSDPAWISQLSGEDGVSLVLPVGVVGNQHRTSGAQLGQRLLDGVQHDFSLFTRDSRYFAMTSTSMFTGSPGSRPPRTVPVRVVGMRLTSNHSELTSQTVRDVPLIAIDPFSTTYLASVVGRLNRKTSQWSPGVHRGVPPRPPGAPD